MFNQKFYYMWQKYFIVIILFCLYACKGKRKRSFDNFIVNTLGSLAAYCFFPKKPKIAVQRTVDRQLTLF